jgi:hypothetical protein
MAYDDEILNDLTDEERAALDEPDGGTTGTMGESQDNDEGKEDVDTGAGTGKEGKAGGDDDGADTADNAAGTGAAGDGDGDGTGVDASAASAADVPADKPAPLLVAEVPENADARLKELGEKKGELAEQLDNGDITTREYHNQLEALNKEQGELQRALDKAALAADLNQQQNVNNWHNQINAFTTKAHPEYAASKVRWMALDAFVREVGNDPAKQHLSGPQILAEAHAMVQADLGVAPAKGKADPVPATVDKNAAGRPLKGSKPEAPKTLRDVPTAAANEVDDGKWAALDRLQAKDPEAHEERIMKMSDSERDAYLARA